MKYQILLEDRMKGRKALIECPANMPLEELSVKIKVELQLPLSDRNWHRFLFHGKCYVPFNHLLAEPEIYWEATGRTLHGVRCSDHIRLKHVYTVLGSAIAYQQDDHLYAEHRVRCTLIARV